MAMFTRKEKIQNCEQLIEVLKNLDKSHHYCHGYWNRCALKIAADKEIGPLRINSGYFTVTKKSGEEITPRTYPEVCRLVFGIGSYRRIFKGRPYGWFKFLPDRVNVMLSLEEQIRHLKSWHYPFRF